VYSRAPYNHESSSFQVRNFSDLECSIAVLYAKGKAIGGRDLRIRCHLRLHLPWAPYSENALPIRLLSNTKIVEQAKMANIKEVILSKMANTKEVILSTVLMGMPSASAF